MTPTNVVIAQLDWFSPTDPTSSAGHKIEIDFVAAEMDSAVSFSEVFLCLFGTFAAGFFVHIRGTWGDFCLDTWDPSDESYDIDSSKLSEPTRGYLNFLHHSSIALDSEKDYHCINWKGLFDILEPCILNHVAPFSPYIYSLELNMVCYFHHSHSVGIYYLSETPQVKQILEVATKEGWILRRVK